MQLRAAMHPVRDGCLRLLRCGCVRRRCRRAPDHAFRLGRFAAGCARWAGRLPGCLFGRGSVCRRRIGAGGNVCGVRLAAITEYLLRRKAIFRDARPYFVEYLLNVFKVRLPENHRGGLTLTRHLPRGHFSYSPCAGTVHPKMQRVLPVQHHSHTISRTNLIHAGSSGIWEQDNVLLTECNVHFFIELSQFSRSCRCWKGESDIHAGELARGGSVPCNSDNWCPDGGFDSAAA